MPRSSPLCDGMPHTRAGPLQVVLTPVERGDAGYGQRAAAAPLGPSDLPTFVWLQFTSVFAADFFPDALYIGFRVVVVGYAI